MRKRLSALLVLGVVGLLLASAMPVTAAPGQVAEGHWRYFTWADEIKEVGCSTVMTTHEVSYFTGSIEGYTTSTGSKIIIDCSGGVSYRGVVEFEEATVDGKTGGLALYAAGRAPYPPVHWEGRWVVLRATGDLAGLKGSGTWWGPGAGGLNLWGDVDYAGQLRFGPRH